MVKNIDLSELESFLVRNLLLREIEGLEKNEKEKAFFEVTEDFITESIEIYRSLYDKLL